MKSPILKSIEQKLDETVLAFSIAQVFDVYKGKCKSFPVMNWISFEIASPIH